MMMLDGCVSLTAYVCSEVGGPIKYFKVFDVISSVWFVVHG